jgi:thiol-disulfide isomerase/thioredoxin
MQKPVPLFPGRVSPALLLVAAGLFFIAAAAILLLASGANPAGTGPLRIGQPLAGFSLADMNGQNRQLADYQGKVVLLNIWATWCPPCRSEMPDLQAYYNANLEKGFVILAINAGDSRADVRDFAASYRLSFPILMDPDLNWVRRMAINDYPTSIVIGRDGLVKKVQIGLYSPAAMRADLDPLLKP